MGTPPPGDPGAAGKPDPVAGLAALLVGLSGGLAGVFASWHVQALVVAVTAAFAGLSFVRRERPIAMPLIGFALAVLCTQLSPGLGLFGKVLGGAAGAGR